MNRASKSKPSVRAVNRTEKNGDRHYYYLVAGEILFAVKPEDENGEPQVQQRRLNAIAASDKANITESVLQQAQQALQMNLLKEINGQVEIDVASVVIMAIQPCGFLSETEFHDRQAS